MNLFRRRKVEKPTDTVQLPPHEHKWRDFDWFTMAKHKDGRYDIWIYEPYVCVSCGERKDIELLHVYGPCSAKDFDKVYEKQIEPYRNHIKPKAIVEDAVHDAIMVDREFIEAWDKLHNMKAEAFIKMQSGRDPLL